MADTPSIIDSREKIAELDVSNALGSIELLSDQIREAWEETQDIQFTPEAEIRNVVVNGMGGSGLGAHVIQHVFKEKLTVPLEVIHSYDLPNYVDEHTLVVISSYSGNTEEPLHSIEQAEAKKAQIVTITAGGKLKKLAEERNYPSYFIDPQFNPSNQPRMAIGNSVFGQIGLLSKAGVISLTDEEVEEVITTVIRTVESNTVEKKTEESQAKLIAYECLERRPILVSSEFMEGSLHVSANQFNENAKIFADYKIVPELNHHLMEGLKFPQSNQGTHLFLFMNSQLFSASNQKRMKLTQEIVEKNHIDALAVQLTSETKLTQVFESIALLAFANFYLSMLEGIDPCPIPFVDEFKEKLSS